MNTTDLFTWIWRDFWSGKTMFCGCHDANVFDGSPIYAKILKTSRVAFGYDSKTSDETKEPFIVNCRMSLPNEILHEYKNHVKIEKVNTGNNDIELYRIAGILFSIVDNDEVVVFDKHCEKFYILLGV